jgi:hypothetical protein
MLNCIEYSAVIVKWLASKHLRADDYSAVMVNYLSSKELRQIARFFAGTPCVRALLASPEHVVLLDPGGGRTVVPGPGRRIVRIATDRRPFRLTLPGEERGVRRERLNDVNGVKRMLLPVST